MRDSWLPPEWHGRQRIAHPVNWARLPEYDIGVAFVQARVDHGHENRWYLYVRKFNEADVKAFPVLASTVITSSPGSTQTITSDPTWNNASNSIECIGAGARGAIGASTATSGGGGGGGAYTKIANASITTPGTTQYFAQVGGVTATNGSAGGDSWWTLTSPGTSYPASGTAVGAKGAPALASATTATGGLGGPSSGSYPGGAGPAAKSNGGGGGNSAAAQANSGGGGGGAGGFSGDGASVGGTGPTAGGAGNANASGGGTGGGVGNPGVAGGNGTNIQTGPNVGSGGGGGGGNAAPSTGGAGGLYGGGGGGGGRSNGVGGQGAQGVIVLTWTPIFTGTLAATEVADTAALTGTDAWTATLTAQDGTPYELLLHFDGANASTTIVDSGGKGHTVTTHGTAQIDTSQPVFSSSALKLASGGDYIDIDIGAGIIGTIDFTIDFRARLTSGSTAQTFYDGGTGNFKIDYDGTNLRFVSAAGTISGGALASNTNYHIAVTRAAGSVRLFKDGTQVGSTLTDAAFYTGTFGYPQIGSGVAVVSGTLVTTEASDVAALAGTAGGFDAATTAWESAVVAAGGTVSSGRKTVVDNLIVGLKTDGIWSKLDRLWILAAENNQSARVDLVAVDVATAVNSPTFTINHGYAGDASTSYLDTTFNAATQGVNFTLNSAHMAVWDNSNRGGSLWCATGTNDGTNVSVLYPYQVGLGLDGVLITVNQTAAVLYQLAGTTSQGFFLGQRASSSSVEISYNGAALSAASTTSTAIPSLSFFVGGRNDNGSLGVASGDQISMASYGGKLTSTNLANYYSRLFTYMVASVVQSWKDAVVAAGGSVSSGRETLVTALVNGLMTDGVWWKLDRLWIFAAENTQSALVDLVADSLATATNSPTFTTNLGYKGNGSSMYIDSNFNPTSGTNNYVQNGASLAVWDYTGTADTGPLLGVALPAAAGNGENFFLLGGTGTFLRVNDNPESVAISTTASGTGFYLGNRSSSTGREAYKNGVSLGTYGSVSSQALLSSDFVFLGWLGTALAINGCAAASIGGSLNSTEQGNLYSRIRTYMTAVGVP